MEKAITQLIMTPTFWIIVYIVGYFITLVWVTIRGYLDGRLFIIALFWPIMAFLFPIMLITFIIAITIRMAQDFITRQKNNKLNKDDPDATH